ncbi:hypothetical protein Nepgr_014738 [Nepenthes gracilis]|uniref:Uncharacterized protein n=1 Tax=Nepenthes gracilis TaxID=150966 RepID=A0AAD3XPS5_NEPGR|nr:hypothetical protein Nepgr_014738 [Nepenthes gracilis]
MLECGWCAGRQLMSVPWMEAGFLMLEQYRGTSGAHPFTNKGSAIIQHPLATQSWNQQCQQHHSTPDCTNYIRQQHRLNTIIDRQPTARMQHTSNSMPPKRILPVNIIQLQPEFIQQLQQWQLQQLYFTQKQ